MFDAEHAGTPALESDYREVGDWLAGRLLGDFDLESLFAELLERITGEGQLPLCRAHLSLSSLHPMFRSYSITWVRGAGTRVDFHTIEDEGSDRWQSSPLRALLESDERTFRASLEAPGDWQRFPVLQAFRDEGGTEYLAELVPFSEPARARRLQDGMVVSWICDQPGGFSRGTLAAIHFLVPRIGLAAKLAKREQTAENIVSAYLGSETGRRVLEGQIERGDMEVIPAVIWYSDLRDSTALTRRFHGQRYLSILNEYFECTAGAVLEHGGEVLRFIGDAVLAIFPMSGAEGPARWGRVALAAARSAHSKLAVVNERRVGNGEEPLDFGLALHAGEVYFGNIGVPERVEFSVIGPVANEVARMEDLTKTLGEPVVVSRQLTRALRLEWRPLGAHRLRGVGEPIEVFAPPRRD